jgi:hypothetical protein
MIVSFRDSDTEALAGGKRVKRFVAFESVARRKLRQLEIAGRLEDLRVPPENSSRRSRATAPDSTASASTISIGCASSGPRPDRKTSRSWTTTRR